MRETTEDSTLRQRLGPVPAKSGFHMDGWFVWCGSVIKVEDEYHLFSARWPVASGFPDGYRDYSEIVRAVARNPLGPYTFQEVVIAKRSGDYWDGRMAHNPAIYQSGGKFFLYYIGSPLGSHYREIGLATADRITGPWRRPDCPLNLGVECDATNPAALFEPDGSVKLVWRTPKLRVRISVASDVEGPYSLVNENVWPSSPLEDFFYFKRDGQYHILCEDAAGKVSGHERWGCRLVSENGLDGWRCNAAGTTAYDHTIIWADRSMFLPVRRERPWLLVEDGKVTALFTGVYDGHASWNQPVPILPPWPMTSQSEFKG